MVQITNAVYLESDGTINPDKWLHAIREKRVQDNLEELEHALFLSELVGKEQPSKLGLSCLQHGLAMAELLENLGLDIECISAALLFETAQNSELSEDIIREQVSSHVAALITGTARMQASSSLTSITNSNISTENIRMMLLAMVEDVRVVLIKLAEQVCLIRAIDILPEKEQLQVARECRDIYAPLANRLGISLIKWELEDRSFRTLEDEKYRHIAKSLGERRLQREEYIEHIINTIKLNLFEQGLKHVEVTGRVKHIFGIHKKMLRKRCPFSEIYDANAVRILVDSVEECYRALDVVHTLWQQIPVEFDDYIANPKANGYQSIHTAVVADNNKNVEIQIRTRKMHQDNEIGVAAHWVYKEGKQQKSNYEAKISWLRQVLDWQKELVKQGQALDEQALHVFNDRVYVFTPRGDVLDLQKGATPLDFAYTVHTEVGHRCRGAKINNQIVPLTYELQTGDRVEVLTGKEAKPSRDWLNPHLNYLHTSRAKAKVHHWFKQQSLDENAARGQQLLEEELKRLSLICDDFSPFVKKHNYKTIKDLYAAIGAGDLTTQQICSSLQSQQRQKAPAATIINKPRATTKSYHSDISVLGVGNLLTHIARCCTPVPGEPIVGYITRGRGVAIHKRDCPNILNADTEQQRRLIEVDWGEKTKELYPIRIQIKSYDRTGLVRDITETLANEKINVIGLLTKTNKDENIAEMEISIEIKNLDDLTRLLDKIQQISNVFYVKRSG